MAKVVYAARTLSNLERLEETTPGAAALIRSAVSVLEKHPFIGRSVEAGLRELVVSYGKTGFVALYRFRVDEELVIVLALCHQRDAGW